MRFFIFLICLLVAIPSYAQNTRPTHALAMHGDLKYGPDFKHFEYVNPEAPKGGTMKLSGAETFDSFNPFITRGVAADGLGLLYASLLEKSQDEAFSMYGALAETLEVPKDRSWVIFNIRKDAVWHDGQPITAQDVVWTFNTLVEKGRPLYKAYYAHVEKVEALSDKRVKFTFDMKDNLELPLIIGELAILPKHYWETRDFERTTLEPPLGSGPYKISAFDQGRSVSYERVKNWWGDNLPVYKGRYNFNRIGYEYYRDQDVSLRALFGGEFDFRLEYTAKLWATSYNIPAVKDGRITKATIPHQLPQGMQGFSMNIRRPVWQDKNVRKAMNLAFDFEWSNKQFAYDAYTRSRSYFSNSEMESTGLPEGRELEILEKFRSQLPPEVFSQEFVLPKTDGSGNNRDNLREAMRILDEAGYVMGKDGVRVHKDTGVRLEFELLIANTNVAFERWFGPYKKSLQRIGIKGTLRVVDASQYINRVMDTDFDMIVGSWGQSTSPGNEQREYWGSDRADVKGSRNFIGIKDPVVDALITEVIASPSREELVFRTRALDRVLQYGWYVIPNWHIPAWRVAYWNKFERPAVQAEYNLGEVDTWWAKPQ